MDESEQVFFGTTVNISTGGVLINTKNNDLTVGDRLALKMMLPPESGLLEQGGRMSVYAQVKRVNSLIYPTENFNQIANTDTHSIALQFCNQPSYCY